MPSEEPANDKNPESAIARITEKILKESGIRGAVINSRILNVFKKKNFVLHSAFKDVRANCLCAFLVRK